MDNYRNRSELYHYGVLGMRWGIRKDNDPRYKHYTRSMKATGYGSARSKNPFLGRRLNASYDERVKRGAEFNKRGRTVFGQVARGFVRTNATNFLASMAGATVAGIMAGSGQYESASLLSSLVSAGLMAYSVSSIARTVQDVRDISAYEQSQYFKKNR